MTSLYSLNWNFLTNVESKVFIHWRITWLYVYPCDTTSCSRRHNTPGVGNQSQILFGVFFGKALICLIKTYFLLENKPEIKWLVFLAWPDIFVLPLQHPQICYDFDSFSNFLENQKILFVLFFILCSSW